MIFHRQPLQHQLRDFERFKDQSYFALFYEQRARKTKVVLDIFRYRYARGDIDALIVIAWPNGVHRVWIDELPKDFPPDELTHLKSLAWRSGRMTKGPLREEALALREYQGPVVLTMNCEALITNAGTKYLEWFLAKRRALLVADESSWSANWNGRTQRLLAMGRRPNVVIKAILDGTPVDESPVEIYHPTNFLKPGLLGFTSKDAFRSRYLQYEEEEIAPGVRVRKRRHNYKTDTDYDVVVGVQNMEELRDNLKAFSSRVLRSEVSDAPPKTYQQRYFQLTDRQRMVYDRARDEYVADLAQGPTNLRNVLLRMTRLQMIARNYYPSEKTGEPCDACQSMGHTADGEECQHCEGLGYTIRWTNLERIDKRSPATEALVAEAAATRGPMIVWCRFKQDVADACQALAQMGRRVARYDGSVPEADRERAYQGFRAGQYDDIVATITSGLSRGKDLTRAVTLVYYSNEFSLRARRQSEDRAEGLDRQISTEVVDLVAEDTRDIDVIAALREKRDLAAVITGDPPSKWL